MNNIRLFKTALTYVSVVASHFCFAADFSGQQACIHGLHENAEPKGTFSTFMTLKQEHMKQAGESSFIFSSKSFPQSIKQSVQPQKRTIVVYSHDNVYYCEVPTQGNNVRAFHLKLGKEETYVLTRRPAEGAGDMVFAQLSDFPDNREFYMNSSGEGDCRSSLIKEEAEIALKKKINADIAAIPGKTADDDHKFFTKITSEKSDFYGKLNPEKITPDQEKAIQADAATAEENAAKTFGLCAKYIEDSVFKALPEELQAAASDLVRKDIALQTTVAR